MRHRGYSQPDAEDLTQGFFHFFLLNKKIQVVDRNKGKFRAFLLAALKGYMTNEWNRQHAIRRGGSQTIISLDEKTAEERYHYEPTTNVTPDQIFEKGWATTVFDRALEHLKGECAQSGKTSLFNQLQNFLVEKTDMSAYRDAAEILGISANAVAVNVHRMRQRYRQHLRDEIARTVGSEEEVEEEMRHLFVVASNTRTGTS